MFVRAKNSYKGTQNVRNNQIYNNFDINFVEYG